MNQHPRAILRGSSIKLRLTGHKYMFCPGKFLLRQGQGLFTSRYCTIFCIYPKDFTKWVLLTLCNLCEISEETTTHLFVNCPITTNLWQTIQRKCSPSLTVPDISVSTVLLGFFSEPSDQNIMIKNQVLLSCKQFIYKHRADSPKCKF